jgi:hypothetical protein
MGGDLATLKDNKISVFELVSESMDVGSLPSEFRPKEFCALAYFTRHWGSALVFSPMSTRSLESLSCSPWSMTIRYAEQDQFSFSLIRS